MKQGRRVLTAVLLAVWIAVSAAAAPDALVPVGRCVGITMHTEGVTVVGFAEGGSAAQEAGVHAGDRIVSIDDAAVNSPAEIRAQLRPGTRVVLRVLREGRENSFTVQLPDTDELGVMVRSGVSGIGTVTYYDPDAGVFGALGHGVGDGAGALLTEGTGQIVPAEVTEVVRGEPGQPGMLRGAYTPEILGEIERNTEAGVFGHGTLPAVQAALPVGEAEAGEAVILANISGAAVEQFAVRILETDTGAATRNLLVQVTDSRLLEATGGIVQGMSGSPIIQDGKLVGAVTHVLVNDPTRGYGIQIENMLAAAG